MASRVVEMSLWKRMYIASLIHAGVKSRRVCGAGEKQAGSFPDPVPRLRQQPFPSCQRSIPVENTRTFVSKCSDQRVSEVIALALDFPSNR